jgi:hypothetical protein
MILRVPGVTVLDHPHVPGCVRVGRATVAHPWAGDREVWALLFDDVESLAMDARLEKLRPTP